MWEVIVGWIKGLFGGKGSTQIGKDNQAVAGSTRGHNSPIVTGGRDVYLNMRTDEGAQVFADLEETMPGFMAELRSELKEHPLFRDLIVLDKETIPHNWPEDHLMFSEREHPGVRRKIRVLENHGLLEELKDNFAYRMSARLVTYLRK